MSRSRKLKHLLSGVTALFAWQSVAWASFLDTDFWCRTYGCAVVHDGQNLDIYDNYIFSQQRCCVANGSPMIPYSSNFSSFNLTGSLNKDIAPSSDQGMMLGITQNGTNVSQSIIDDGDGFLDAGDGFGGVFALNPNTDVVLDAQGRQYSHSFFITSRNTRMSLRARASIRQSTDDFAQTISLDDIGVQPSISNRGNDDGFNYGGRANRGNIRVDNSISTLGDLAGTPTTLIDFNRNSGIRQRNGDINEQTIRLDFLYTMPAYDFSMGIGTLDIDMVFDLYRER